MFTQPLPDLAPIIGASIVGIVLYLVLLAGITALSIWIFYTIIWRAVRRGLREFHNPAVKSGRQNTQQFSGDPRAW